MYNKTRKGTYGREPVHKRDLNPNAIGMPVHTLAPILNHNKIPSTVQNYTNWIRISDPASSDFTNETKPTTKD